MLKSNFFRPKNFNVFYKLELGKKIGTAATRTYLAQKKSYLARKKIYL